MAHSQAPALSQGLPNQSEPHDPALEQDPGTVLKFDVAQVQLTMRLTCAMCPALEPSHQCLHGAQRPIAVLVLQSMLRCNQIPMQPDGDIAANRRRLPVRRQQTGHWMIPILRPPAASFSLAACPRLSSQKGTHVAGLGKLGGFSESESDNATEGVIWKARDLWSAPVIASRLACPCMSSETSIHYSFASAVITGCVPATGRALPAATVRTRSRSSPR